MNAFPERHSNIKVLYLQDHASVGGAQLSLLDLLKGFRQAGCPVTPIVLLGEAGFLERQLQGSGIDARTLQFPAYRRVLSLFSRRKFLRHVAAICAEKGIQIVHANVYQAAPWSAKAARLAGAASCVTVRETIDAARALRYRVPDNDAVIAVSKEVASLLPPHPASHQIYDAVRRPAFREESAEALEQLGLSKHRRKRIAYLGTLSERKGPHVLLEAMPRILRRVPDAECVLMGGGDTAFETGLREKANALNLGGHVVFSGKVEGGADYLRLFDALAVPSFVEGLGRSAIEGMYAGLPVVASRVGGLPEVVDEGQSGTLVPAGDAAALAEALTNYLMDDPLRRSHGEAGRRRAESLFDICSCARKVSDFYSSLMSASGRNGRLGAPQSGGRTRENIR